MNAFIDHFRSMGLLPHIVIVDGFNDVAVLVLHIMQSAQTVIEIISDPVTHIALAADAYTWSIGIGGHLCRRWVETQLIDIPDS